MLRIEEFNAAADAHYRRAVVAMFASIAGLFACFGLAALSREFLLGNLTDQFGVVGAETFIAVLLVVGVLIFLTGMWLGYRRSRRDARLLCPHCGTLLVQSVCTVVATRNCVRCGRRVLAEPDDCMPKRDGQ